MDIEKAKQSLLASFNIEIEDQNSIADYAIILGSGIKCNPHSINSIESKSINYSQVIGLPEINVVGHSGKITLSKLENGKKLLIFAGRFHLYEGYSSNQVQSIVKLIDALGVKNVLITNAAGGVNQSLSVTDLMLITGIRDYQNDGELDYERGLLNCLTKKELLIETQLTKKIKEESNLKHGTYAAVLGPNYETESEIELFKSQNCSAVGMSTYLEVKYCLENNLDVAAVSVITNSWFNKEIPTHEEVIENSSKAQNKFDRFLNTFLKNE